MIARSPKPRSQSANATRPRATARTSLPTGARKVMPCHRILPPARDWPNCLSTLPSTGQGSSPLAGATPGSAGDATAVSSKFRDQGLQALAVVRQSLAFPAALRKVRTQCRHQALPLAPRIDQTGPRGVGRPAGLLQRQPLPVQLALVVAQRVGGIAQFGDQSRARIGQRRVVSLHAVEELGILLVQQRLQRIALGEPPSLAKVRGNTPKVVLAVVVEAFPVGTQLFDRLPGAFDAGIEFTYLSACSGNTPVRFGNLALLGGNSTAGVVQPTIEGVQALQDFGEFKLGILRRTDSGPTRQAGNRHQQDCTRPAREFRTMPGHALTVRRRPPVQHGYRPTTARSWRQDAASP